MKKFLFITILLSSMQLFGMELEDSVQYDLVEGSAQSKSAQCLKFELLCEEQQYGNYYFDLYSACEWKCWRMCLPLDDRLYGFCN